MNVIRAWCGCCLGVRKHANETENEVCGCEHLTFEAEEQAPLLDNSDTTPHIKGPGTTGPHVHSCLFQETVIEDVLRRLRRYVIHN